MKPLKRAIADFEKAQKHLDKCEKELNKSVGPLLKECGEDLYAIQGLIEQLPKGYNGTRKLYELIYRIQKSSIKN